MSVYTGYKGYTVPQAHIQALSDWYALARQWCRDYDDNRPCIREPAVVSFDRMTHNPRLLPTTIGPIMYLPRSIWSGWGRIVLMRRPGGRLVAWYEEI